MAARTNPYTFSTFRLITVFAGFLLWLPGSWAAGPVYNGNASAPAVHELAKRDVVKLIDIRRPSEWRQTGVGRTAHKISMHQSGFVSRLDALVSGNRGSPVALICARGHRSGRHESAVERVGLYQRDQCCRRHAGLPVRTGLASIKTSVEMVNDPMNFTHQKTPKHLAILTIAVMLLTIFAQPVLAKSPIKELNLSSKGLALRGYDPVSYFASGKPVKGSNDISVLHAGGRYLFSTLQNKQAFVADPVRYLPAYGGFCSYGAASNYKVDGDPKVWNIVGGKLYLNINRSIDKAWNRKQSFYINKADKNWPKIRSK